MKVLVTGGTGFIGSRVVHALRAEDRAVRVLVRNPGRARQLESWGAEAAPGEIGDAESLRRAVDGCTHVVHLVAIIQGRPQDFDRVMTAGTASLLDAAKSAGVERFVHMSALGTTPDGAVPYYRAKWAMEQAVAASGLAYTTFRPSFVFGAGGALPTFVKQVRYAPVVTVIGNGRQRSQPIWVDDVAAYVTRALDAEQAVNRTFELGGPDVVDWNELYALIAKLLGKRRAFVHVPFAVARAGALATQWLPGAPLHVDQVTMLQGADNVVSDPAATEVFGLPLVPLAEQIRRVVG